MTPIDRVNDWAARCGLGRHVPVLIVAAVDGLQKTTALVCVEAEEVMIKLDSYDAPNEKHVLHINKEGNGRVQGVSDRDLSLSWTESESGEVRLEIREKDNDTGDLGEDGDIHILLPLQLLDRKFE